MPKRNHEPERTCLGCRRRDSKARMVRLAAAGGVVKLDLPQRASGRGGYVHQREECLHKLVHSKVKEFRSLQRRIGLDERRQIAELIRTRLDRNETLA